LWTPPISAQIVLQENITTRTIKFQQFAKRARQDPLHLTLRVLAVIAPMVKFLSPHTCTGANHVTRVKSLPTVQAYANNQKMGKYNQIIKPPRTRLMVPEIVKQEPLPPMLWLVKFAQQASLLSFQDHQNVKTVLLPIKSTLVSFYILFLFCTFLFMFFFHIFSPLLVCVLLSLPQRCCWKYFL
jgi:hypothetical protein